MQHHPSSAETRRGNDFLAPKPSVKLISFRKIARGACCGHVTVEFCGLRINDIAVFQGRAGCALGLPTKPKLDADGRHMRDGDGKPSFMPAVEWSTREQADAFSKAVIALIRARYPAALES